jgi:hypothetical protein
MTGLKDNTKAVQMQPKKRKLPKPKRTKTYPYLKRPRDSFNLAKAAKFLGVSREQLLTMLPEIPHRKYARQIYVIKKGDLEKYDADHFQRPQDA